MAERLQRPTVAYVYSPFLSRDSKALWGERVAAAGFNGINVSYAYYSRGQTFSFVEASLGLLVATTEINADSSMGRVRPLPDKSLAIAVARQFDLPVALAAPSPSPEYQAWEEQRLGRCIPVGYDLTGLREELSREQPS